MRRSGLSRERVVEAAAAWIDRFGTAGFSMRALAESLNIRTASLYNHVESMEGLMIEVCGYAPGMQQDIELQAIAGLHGAAAIEALSQAYRRFAREHRELYRLIVRTAASCYDSLGAGAGLRPACGAGKESNTAAAGYGCGDLGLLRLLSFLDGGRGRCTHGAERRPRPPRAFGGIFDAGELQRHTEFQATGRRTQPLILSLLRRGGLNIPLMLLFDHLSGVKGVAWATPFADLLALGMSACLLLPYPRKLSMKQE